MMKTVFVVSQQEPLTALVDAFLAGEGLEVVTAPNGEEAITAAQREKPDLILLDLMMVDRDSYELLRSYAQEWDAPLFLLLNTAKHMQRVPGQGPHANGRINQPLSSEELAARIHNLLRCLDEARPGPQHPLARAAGVELDRSGRAVTVGERRVDLTPAEFNLLATLMAVPGRVFSRRDLLEAIQGEAPNGCERTVDVHVSNLRTKIERDPGHPRYVQTVYGIGYRFALADADG
jgi:DNA-binding response OmpR family regulator